MNTFMAGFLSATLLYIVLFVTKKRIGKAIRASNPHMF